MKHILYCYIALVLTAVILSCGRKVMVPPRIDLVQYEVIGIIEFESSHEGELGNYTTRKFIGSARRDQGMVRIVDLGSEAEVLKAIGHKRLNSAAYKALGEQYDLNTIITGELAISDIRPDITITPGLGFMSLSAEVDATLDVQMIETTTGASIWSSSANATQHVGHVSIFGGGNFAFDAEDPDEAYGKLINKLVEKTTRDFRVTWRRE